MQKAKRRISPVGKVGFTLIELIVVIVVFILTIAVLTPFVRMAQVRAHAIACNNNLCRISLGLHQYAVDNGRAFPPTLGLLYPDYVKDERTFDCPASKVRGLPDKPDYTYVPKLSESSPLNKIIVCDLEGNHGKGGINVLRIGGFVGWIASGPKEKK